MWRPGRRLFGNLGVNQAHRQPVEDDGGMLAKRFRLCQDKLDRRQLRVETSVLPH